MKIAFYALNDSFSGPVLEELQSRHIVKKFRPTQGCLRGKPDALDHFNVLRLYDWCDLAYCEWIHYPLPLLTQLQVVNKPIVTYMDGIDVLGHHAINWSKVSLLIVQTMQGKRLEFVRRWWHLLNPGNQLPPLPKVVCVDRPIDRDLFKIADRDPGYDICLHSNVIRATKRIYTTLQCFNELIHKDPEKPWTLYLIGRWEGGWAWPARQEYVMVCHELIEQMNLNADQLRLISQSYPRKEWVEFIKTKDIYWNFSFREGFPNSVAEAAASGVYPLMNRFAGAELLYPEKYICDWPSQLVEKTIAWGNLSLEEKLAEKKKARKHTKQWDAKKTVIRMRELVETMLS